MNMMSDKVAHHEKFGFINCDLPEIVQTKNKTVFPFYDTVFILELFSSNKIYDFWLFYLQKVKLMIHLIIIILLAEG